MHGRRVRRAATSCFSLSPQAGRGRPSKRKRRRSGEGRFRHFASRSPSPGSLRDPPSPRKRGEGKTVALASSIAHLSRPHFSISHASSLSRAGSRRSFPIASLDLRSPQKRGARLHSQKEGAERRNGATALSVLLRKSTCRPCDRPARLTALHRGVIRWWDPSAPPARQGSLGPGHLTRRRDGRFHPTLQ